jgi:hypothetical protein
MPRSGLLAEQSVLTPQRAEADKRTCSRDPRSRSPIAVLDLTTEHIERADLSGMIALAATAACARRQRWQVRHRRPRMTGPVGYIGKGLLVGRVGGYYRRRWAADRLPRRTWTLLSAIGIVVGILTATVLHSAPLRIGFTAFWVAYSAICVVQGVRTRSR